MTFETTIRELSDLYLSDARAPDIAGFVDQLFHVAADTGAVACVFDGEKSLRFFVRPGPKPSRALLPSSVQLDATCVVEHHAARTILRMICARIGVICKDRSTSDISPYGDKAVIEYEIQNHRRWSIAFTNTSERQEFLVEAV